MNNFQTQHRLKSRCATANKFEHFSSTPIKGVMAKVLQSRRRLGAWHTCRRAALPVGVLLAFLIIACSRAAAASAEANKPSEADVGSSPTAAATPDLIVPAPKGTNRVTAAAVFQPATAHRGETVTLFVKMRIAPGHWI